MLCKCAGKGIVLLSDLIAIHGASETEAKVSCRDPSIRSLCSRTILVYQDGFMHMDTSADGQVLAPFIIRMPALEPVWPYARLILALGSPFADRV